MTTLASGLSYVDLDFLGVPRIIATVVLHGPGGAALIDPGPSSTLPALRAALSGAGIAIADLRAVLLTHIHFDHAGATGTLVHEQPALKVYVHEKGAPHMASPERLIASATRLWGDEMDRLWGEFRPVPPEALSLRGGERVSAGGRDLEAPHAGPRLPPRQLLSKDTGIAFVGDTAGIAAGRLHHAADAAAGHRSRDLGRQPPPPRRVAAGHDLRDALRAARAGRGAPDGNGLAPRDGGELVKASLARPGSDEDREAWFADELRRELRRRMSESDARAYEVAGRFDLNWKGLARYWRKKGN
jgi:glyoxylase-like metal-dependent hydrolase (beta-lactamase superfamily II)